jgi:GNAT superfamily N-acetyltransferase
LRERLEGRGQLDLAARLSEFPEIEEALSIPVLRLEVLPGSTIGARDGQLLAEVHVRYRRENGLEAGTLSLDIDTEDGVSIEDIHIAPQLQTFGLGRVLVSEVVAFSAELDFAQVDIRAFDVGRYAWARCGFDFVDQDERTRVVEAAQEFARRLGERFDPAAVGCSWELAELEGPEIPREVFSECRGDRSSEGRPLKFGQALLLGPRDNEWTGRFDVADGSDSQRQLDKVINEIGER